MGNNLDVNNLLAAINNGDLKQSINRLQQALSLTVKAGTKVPKIAGLKVPFLAGLLTTSLRNFKTYSPPC
ncbi:MAG: hypothetical protein GX893_08290 [Firmicutes bacterium]|nr:hypothetical protein [Bacillota bacterium]